jgi:receptor protein-tyrosine kinase
MSRVHDALRRAAQKPEEPPKRRPSIPLVSDAFPSETSLRPEEDDAAGLDTIPAAAESGELDMQGILATVADYPYNPMPDALLVNSARPREGPGEEFRTLRTRLNHLQTLQPLHTLVVTSASPAEGKSFTATNLALTQAQLAGKSVMLADFDFRRPTVDKAFQLSASPGITDYLRGKASLNEVIRKIASTNLHLMTSGESVPNPLELLNLKECRQLLDSLREHFDWVILDSPPLLFAADGNLLATMCDATILVVRIGSTTFDAVTRALQSLCENNVLGIVVNGARRGELYSKYSYYHDYYDPAKIAEQRKGVEEVEAEVDA